MFRSAPLRSASAIAAGVTMRVAPQDFGLAVDSGEGAATATLLAGAEAAALATLLGADLGADFEDATRR